MPWCWRLTNLVLEPPHCSDPLSLPGLEPVLNSLGISDSRAWRTRWADVGGSSLALEAWGHPVTDAFVWSVGFPLLTALEGAADHPQRQLFGLSGLPGCGKSTLTRWIAAAAKEIDLPIAVISLDDFYYPGEELDRVMAGNPWRVPRALPGSHDLSLLQRAMDSWRTSGLLRAPCFEKSLRHGKGDRSDWSEQRGQVCLLEGWFVGVRPSSQLGDDPLLTTAERDYQPLVQKHLARYVPLWESLDGLWHLRASNVEATRLWKRQQEETMHRRTGVQLPAPALNSFVRMIETAMPQASYQHLEHANVVVHLNDTREVLELTRA